MIHAHEILKLIGNNERAYTKQSLQETVNGTFGEEALFTNCSGSAFNFDEVFQFFIDRSKVNVHDDETISLQKHNICG